MTKATFVGYKDIVVMTLFLGVFSPLISALSLPFVSESSHGWLLYTMLGCVSLSVIGGVALVKNNTPNRLFSIWRVLVLVTTAILMIATQVLLGVVIVGAVLVFSFLLFYLLAVLLFILWRFRSQGGELDQDGAMAAVSGPYAAIAPLSILLQGWLMRQDAGMKASFLCMCTSISLLFSFGSLVWISLKKREQIRVGRNRCGQ